MPLTRLHMKVSVAEALNNAKAEVSQPDDRVSPGQKCQVLLDWQSVHCPQLLKWQ